MKSSIRTKTVLCALLLAFTFTSCVGTFNASRRIHTWNREIDNRWLGEGVFLVFRFLPVYAAAAVGDLLIFNSMAFWGWDNPIDPPDPARLKALQEADDARMSSHDEDADHDADSEE